MQQQQPLTHSLRDATCKQHSHSDVCESCSAHLRTRSICNFCCHVALTACAGTNLHAASSSSSSCCAAAAESTTCLCSRVALLSEWLTRSTGIRHITAAATTAHTLAVHQARARRAGDKVHAVELRVRHTLATATAEHAIAAARWRQSAVRGRSRRPSGVHSRAWRLQNGRGARCGGVVAACGRIVSARRVSQLLA